MRDREFAYVPLKAALFRTPALSIDRFNALNSVLATSGNISPPSLLDAVCASADERHLMVAAIAVASPALFAALHSLPSKPSRRQRLLRSVSRYLVRSATRPAPFGLCSGVGIVEFGPVTNLRIDRIPHKTIVRLDMSWLSSFATSLETQADVRRQLMFYANPLTEIRRDKIYVAGRLLPTSEIRSPCKRTEISNVIRLLERAQIPVAHEVLSAWAIEDSVVADVDEADDLITELWRRSILLTDLSPPLTTDDPARYLLRRLSTISASGQETNVLQEMIDDCESWQTLPLSVRAVELGRLRAKAITLGGKSESNTHQVDMSVQLSGGQISIDVGQEVARAATVLFRITPFPYGLTPIAAYRQAFITRYGEHREVPVLELLDPNRGLGPYDFYTGSSSVSLDRANRRREILLQLACEANFSRSRMIELNDDLVEQLSTWNFRESELPPSLEVNVRISAKSAADIDRGKFEVVIAPLVGSVGAARGWSRFHHLLPSPIDFIQQSCQSVAKSRFPNDILVEVVYMPSNTHMANVAVHKSFRNYGLFYGVFPHVDRSGIIPMDELVIGVRDNRFYIRWPRINRCVRVCIDHLLSTTYHAPPACRLLNAICQDGTPQLEEFDWGPAKAFPYLPRVKFGRLILKLAHWRISARTINRNARQRDLSDEQLDQWRERWLVPRTVQLLDGDSQYSLDLETKWQRRELIERILKLRDGQSLVVQEVFPDIDDTWVEGPTGKYAADLVIPLVTKDPNALIPTKIMATEIGPSIQTRTAMVSRYSAAAGDLLKRLKTPGSDWLFIQIKSGQQIHEKIIAEPLREFCQMVIENGWASKWFYVRYFEGGSQLRLRFRVSKHELQNQLQLAASEWATRLMTDELCNSFSIETYERELERYGGELGMSVSEDLFFYDSVACAEMIRIFLNQPNRNRLTIATLSVKSLLDSFGISIEESHEWLLKEGPEPDEIDSRKRGPVRRASRSSSIAQSIEASQIQQILLQRHEKSRQAIEELKSLQSSNQLTVPRSSIVNSLLHMSLNRLLGPNRSAEDEVRRLLIDSCS